MSHRNISESDMNSEKLERDMEKGAGEFNGATTTPEKSIDSSAGPLGAGHLQGATVEPRGDALDSSSVIRGESLNNLESSPSALPKPELEGLTPSKTDLVAPTAFSDAERTVTRLSQLETVYSIFTPRQKMLIVIIVAVAAMFSGLSANIYYPALPTISVDVGVSEELMSLTITSYMIFQGLSPAVWGAVADSIGRRFTYICTFTIYIGACVGLALANKYDQIVILRCLQSTGSASTIAIGGGVIGDITERKERGSYMGYFQAGLLTPVAVGPIIGGALAGSLGWHSIFWFLTIFAACFFVVLVITLPETLRSLVGNGSVPARGFAVSLLGYLQQRRLARDLDSGSLHHAAGRTVAARRKIDFLAPLRILFNIESFFIIIYVAIYYTAWQMAISSMSNLFKAHYGLSTTAIGLCFIANGVGSSVGTLSTGLLQDRDFARFREAYKGHEDDFPLEKARLRSAWFYSCLSCASLLVYGWSVDYNVHVALPIICTFFLGWASTSIQTAVTTLLVDSFPKQSASSVATINFSRCLLGAGGTAAVLPLTKAISVGWTFTMLTFILLCSNVFLLIQMRYGIKWRTKREHAL